MHLCDRGMWMSSFLPIRHCYGRVFAHSAMSHLMDEHVAEFIPSH